MNLPITARVYLFTAEKTMSLKQDTKIPPTKTLECTQMVSSR
jgi:hypothetical protein